VLLDRVGERAEEDAFLAELRLVGGRDGDAVEDGVDGDVGRGARGGIGPLDAEEDLLLLERDAQLLVGLQQLGSISSRLFGFFFSLGAE